MRSIPCVTCAMLLAAASLTSTDTPAQSPVPRESIIRSDQCPYIVDATSAAIATADKASIKSCVVELKNRNDLLRLSPSPYGVFGLVLDGHLLSYHYLLEKDLLPLLSQAKLSKAKTAGKDG